MVKPADGEDGAFFKKVTAAVHSSLSATKGTPTIPEFEKTFKEDFPEYPLGTTLAQLGLTSFTQLLEHIPGILLKNGKKGKVVALDSKNDLGAGHIKKLVNRTAADSRDEKKTGRYAPENQKPPKVPSTSRSQLASSSKSSIPRSNDDWMGDSRASSATVVPPSNGVDYWRTHGEHELRSPDPPRFEQGPTIVFGDPLPFSESDAEDPWFFSDASRDDDYEEPEPSRAISWNDVESYVDFLVPLMRKHALVLMIDDIPDMLAKEFGVAPGIFRRELDSFIKDLIDYSDGALTMFYRNGLPFLTLAERFNGDVNVTVPVNHSQDYTELLDAVDDALLNFRIDYDMTICQDNLEAAEKLLQLLRAPGEEPCNIMATPTSSPTGRRPTGLTTTTEATRSTEVETPTERTTARATVAPMDTTLATDTELPTVMATAMDPRRGD
uniref:HTH OST-type domain-containing protein n=1 Tax=Steinernema glaseri TaxID=37863 RepID=A0A1I7Z4R0_9BILA